MDCNQIIGLLFLRRRRKRRRNSSLIFRKVFGPAMWRPESVIEISPLQSSCDTYGGIGLEAHCWETVRRKGQGGSKR